MYEMIDPRILAALGGLETAGAGMPMPGPVMPPGMSAGPMSGQPGSMMMPPAMPPPMVPPGAGGPGPAMPGAPPAGANTSALTALVPMMAKGLLGAGPQQDAMNRAFMQNMMAGLGGRGMPPLGPTRGSQGAGANPADAFRSALPPRRGY